MVCCTLREGEEKRTAKLEPLLLTFKGIEDTELYRAISEEVLQTQRTERFQVCTMYSVMLAESFLRLDINEKLKAYNGVGVARCTIILFPCVVMDCVLVL